MSFDDDNLIRDVRYIAKSCVRLYVVIFVSFVVYVMIQEAVDWCKETVNLYTFVVCKKTYFVWGS